MTQTLASHDTTTSRKTAPQSFQASQKLADSLQQVLVDLTDLHLVAKQLHWNVVGKNFRDTHLVLDEVTDAARAFSDQVAERMRSLHALPDARVKTVAAHSSLPEMAGDEFSTGDAVDTIVAALHAVTGTVRSVHAEVDAEDPTSADILNGVLERLEQLAWMIDAENRVANSSIPRS